MGVSKNRGIPKSSILIGFSIIFTIQFGVPLFLETPKCRSRTLATKTLRSGSGWGRSRRRWDGGRHCRCGSSSGALSWDSTGGFTRIK